MRYSVVNVRQLDQVTVYIQIFRRLHSQDRFESIEEISDLNHLSFEIFPFYIIIDDGIMT